MLVVKSIIMGKLPYQGDPLCITRAVGTSLQGLRSRVPVMTKGKLAERFDDGETGSGSFTNGTATGWFVVMKLQNFQYCRNRGEAAALSGSRGPISCLKLHERSPSLCPGGSREPILCLKLHEVGINPLQATAPSQMHPIHHIQTRNLLLYPS